VFSQLEMKRVEWAAKDGTRLVGAIYHQVGLPSTAPLLVHTHGGPAIMLPCDRQAAANNTRYPYRHLLLAGYRVFTPLYRGTLGMGNTFALANYRSQGSLDGDLGDIIQGIEQLHLDKLLDCRGKIGMFGGSYGGYMTIRALAIAPDVFCAGVAMYGFVMQRWMTFEGGDFTWEDEYYGARNVWPVPKHTTDSDTFSILSQITSPMLLLHGKNDAICPVSQSYPAYWSLKTRDVPTGLVVYPGEGHGFDIPRNKQDACKRTLAWFQHFLPAV
jgi:dipeptidyl aminopeptidase/acylaminoacyl peptidase